MFTSLSIHKVVRAFESQIHSQVCLFMTADLRSRSHVKYTTKVSCHPLSISLGMTAKSPSSDCSDTLLPDYLAYESSQALSRLNSLLRTMITSRARSLTRHRQRPLDDKSLMECHFYSFRRYLANEIDQCVVKEEMGTYGVVYMW
jgi:hypothetical protein